LYTGGSNCQNVGSGGCRQRGFTFNLGRGEGGEEEDCGGAVGEGGERYGQEGSEGPCFVWCGECRAAGVGVGGGVVGGGWGGGGWGGQSKGSGGGWAGEGGKRAVTKKSAQK